MTDEGIIADNSTKLFTKDVLSTQKERSHQEKIIERVRKSNDRKVSTQIRDDAPIFSAQGPSQPKKPRKVQEHGKGKDLTREEHSKTATQIVRGSKVQTRVSESGKSDLTTSIRQERYSVPPQFRASNINSWQKPQLDSDPQYECKGKKAYNNYQNSNNSSNRTVTSTAASNLSSEGDTNYFVPGRHQDYVDMGSYAQPVGQKQTQNWPSYSGTRHPSHRPDINWYSASQSQGNPPLYEHLAAQRQARPLYDSDPLSYDSAMASNHPCTSSQYSSSSGNYQFPPTGHYGSQYQPMQPDRPFGIHQWNNYGHPPGSYSTSEFDGHERDRSANNPPNQFEQSMPSGFIERMGDENQSTRVLTDLDGGLNLTYNRTPLVETASVAVTQPSDLPPVLPSPSHPHSKEAESAIIERSEESETDEVIDKRLNDGQYLNNTNDHWQLSHPSATSSPAAVHSLDFNDENEEMTAEVRLLHDRARSDGLDDEDYNEDWRNVADDVIDLEESIGTRGNTENIDRVAQALAQCLPQHGQSSYDFFFVLLQSSCLSYCYCLMN